MNTLKNRTIVFATAMWRRARTGSAMVLAAGVLVVFLFILAFGLTLAEWVWSTAVSLLLLAAIHAFRALWWVSIPCSLVWSFHPLRGWRQATTPRAALAVVGWRLLTSIVGVALAAVLTENVPRTITDAIPNEAVTALGWAGTAVAWVGGLVLGAVIIVTLVATIRYRD